MDQSQALELMIMSGPDDGTLLTRAAPDHPDGYVLGRREDCDVILPYDSQVSRAHARLSGHNGQWELEDLGSKNGTFIGHVRVVGKMRLEPGQMFRIGRTWLRLQLPGTTKGM
jgi:predicted component of type VI protein secretion system